jgi:hypothetical protein
MAKRTLPIEFISMSTSTEQGDGVEIQWTNQYVTNPAPGTKPFRTMCASVESTRPRPRRMMKYLREDKR